MHIRDILAATPALVLVRVLPAPQPRGGRGPLSDDPRTRTFPPVLRLRDLRRRRHHPRPDPRPGRSESGIPPPSRRFPTSPASATTRGEIDVILARYAARRRRQHPRPARRPAARPARYDWSAGAFRHAADLVRFIRRFNESGRHPDPRGFGIGVAGFPEGHPATPNRMRELDFLKAKVDAGADYICTQLFFDNHDFLDFRDRCASPASRCRSSPASCP